MAFPLKAAVLLAIILTFLQYGLVSLVYVLVSLMSFILGFCFINKHSHNTIPITACKLKRGLPSLISKMTRQPQSRLEKYITGSPNLDNILNKIFDLILEDYVASWYKSITPEDVFILEVRRTMQKIAVNFSKRCHEVDWIPYITQDLPDDFASHIRLYRRAIERLSRDATKTDLLRVFFDKETEMEKTICREDICTKSDREKAHLRQISDLLLYLLMPPEDFKNKVLRYFLRDLIANAIILPTIDLLSDPDFINQYIIWMCKENSYTSEYFIQALRLSDNVDELAAVVDKANQFSVRLRGRDTGGQDDAIIKAQLRSLGFVKKLCSIRIGKLKSGSFDTDTIYQLSHGQPLYMMNLREILSQDIAITAFQEFLSSIGYEQYLNTYINIETYRKTSKQYVRMENEDDCDKQTGREELRYFALQLIRDCKEKLAECPSLSLSSSQGSTGSQGSSGMTSRIPESIINQVMYDIRHEIPNEDSFIELENALLDILKDDTLLGEFQKSHHYIQVLVELDLIRDNTQSTLEDDIFVEKSEDIKSLPLTPEDDTTSGIENLSKSPSSVKLSPSDVITAQIIGCSLCKTEFQSFIIYTIEVMQLGEEGPIDQWQTLRRYSNFDELHSKIIQECGKVSEIRLPAKKAFSNMNKEFLERRRKELDEYLQYLTSHELHYKYPNLRNIAWNFLQRGKWDKRKTVTTRKSPPLLLSPSTVNPLRTMSSAVLSVPENLKEGMTRMFSGRGLSPLGNRSGCHGSSSPTTGVSPSSTFVAPRSASVESLPADHQDSGKVAGVLDMNEADNIPMRILFLMMDEIFDLKQKNQVVRRGIFIILRKIVKAFFGLKVNNIIIEKAQRMTSASQLAVFAEKLKDNWWPGDKPASPQPSRDSATKLRTRVLCRAKMLGSISDELSQYLGNETTRLGVMKIFNLLQEPLLNRRFVYVILEGVLRNLFAENRIRDLHEVDLCPQRQGRICHNRRNANSQTEKNTPCIAQTSFSPIKVNPRKPIGNSYDTYDF